MDRWTFQRDAYRCTLTARVQACEPDGNGWAVVLDDTLLYPEGGGQPDDRGWLDDREVLGLRHRPDGSIAHRMAEPIGGQVEVRLDWRRRFEHMQQHTAQHVLTALALAEFAWPTTAFHLGVQHSDLELEVAELSPDQLAALEQRANEIVRQARPVTCRWVSADEYPRLAVRSRLLPEGLEGPYRLVAVEGLDLNTCSGTHVANTAELQVIALTGSEGLRGGTRVFFLAGDRVLGSLAGALERQRRLNQALSCGPEDHLAALDRLLTDAREASRRQKRTLAELADLLGQHLAAGPAPADLHRPNDDMAFLQAVARGYQRQRPDGWALLTAGQAEGVFVLVGPAERIADVGPRVAEALGGRGGGGAGLYQGKAANLAGRETALELLRSLS